MLTWRGWTCTLRSVSSRAVVSRSETTAAGPVAGRKAASLAGMLALQRSAGNKAVTAAVNHPEPEAVPVQRSAIVLHDYRTYKSPGETALAAARYVVGPGGNVNHDFAK